MTGLVPLVAPVVPGGPGDPGESVGDVWISPFPSNWSEFDAQLSLDLLKVGVSWSTERPKLAALQRAGNVTGYTVCTVPHGLAQGTG